MLTRIVLPNHGLRQGHLQQLAAAINSNTWLRNNLEFLDVSNNGEGDPNEFSTVLFADLPMLSVLKFSNTGVESATLRNLPKLSMLDARDNGLTKITTSNLPVLEHAYLSNNPIEEFDPSRFPQLITLRLRNTKLQRLDVSTLTELLDLTVDTTDMQTLILGNAPLTTNLSFNSEHFDMISLHAIYVHRRKNPETTHDSYNPQNQQEQEVSRQIILTEADVAEYCDIVLQSYRKTLAPTALTKMANWYMKMRVHNLSDRRYQEVPEHLLMDIPIEEFQINARIHLANAIIALCGGVLPGQGISSSQAVIIDFAYNKTPALIDKIGVEAFAKMNANEALQRIIRQRVQSVTNPPTPLVLPTPVAPRWPLWTWGLRRVVNIAQESIDNSMPNVNGRSVQRLSNGT